MHIWESPDRHWGADNITAPLGLEAITSYTPSEHRDYLPGDFVDPENPTFLGESYLHPARFWGLLNVRYVVLDHPARGCGIRARRAGPALSDRACASRPNPPARTSTRTSCGCRAPGSCRTRSRSSDPIGSSSPRRSRCSPWRNSIRGSVVVLQFRSGAVVPPVDRVFALESGIHGATPWNRDRSREALALTPRTATDAGRALQPADQQPAGGSGACGRLAGGVGETGALPGMDRVDRRFDKRISSEQTAC